MKLSLCLLAAVLTVVSVTSAQAASLTRVGNYVGARHVHIKLSLEEDMRRVGVPDQCREEAHQVLTQYVFYGYDTAPSEHAYIDILCAFTPAKAKATSGPLAKPLGQRGTVGGLRYIYFHSKSREVKRYIVPEREERQATGMFAGLLDFVTLTSGSLQCQSGTTCSRGTAWATPISGGSITSNFGHRHSPGGVGSTNHRGMDYGASCGTPIQSVADGVVITSRTQIGRNAAGRATGAGNYCQVRHADGTVTEYFHMQNLNQCVQGATVRQGQPIGTVGNTGGSTGCHLHFGTLVNGQRVDPRTIMATATNVPLTAEQAAALAAQSQSADEANSLLPPIDMVEDGGGLAGEDNPNACALFDGSSTWEDCASNGGAGTTEEDDHDHEHEEGDDHDHS